MTWAILIAVTVVAVQNYFLGRCIMTLQDDLNAAVADLKTRLAAAQQAITDEIARVEATIASLKTGGSVSDAAVQQAITDLGTVSAGLTAAATTLAGEDAPPAPAPAP